MIYQELQNETNDFSYNELTKKIIVELKNEIDRLNSDLINKINKLFNFNELKDENIINNLFQKTISDSMIKRTIAQKIKELEKDENQYNIPYLNIILVGKKGIGKADLISYILELEPLKKENQNYKLDIQEYISEKVPLLKLIEFKGIDYNKDNSINIISANIDNYINNIQKQNYKNTIHCIWHCISGKLIENPEIEFIKNLNKKLPMIIIYTNIESQAKAHILEEYLREQKVDAIFVKTLSKDFMIKNSKIQKSFGREELLNKTIQKCKYFLSQKDIINSIIKNYSKEILIEIKNTNIKIKQNIQNKIIDKFILEYNHIMNDGDLIDYIINTIIENLKEFNFVFLPNKCFNLLNNTFFITEVKNAIVTYKKIIKELINSILEEKAKKFLDMKAKFEIGNDNMEIKNKKTLKELKAFIEIFLKKKFILYFSKINDIIYNR